GGDVAQPMAFGDEPEATVVGAHGIDRSEGLHEAAATVDVLEQRSAVAAVITVLVVREGDLIAGSFDMSLVDQLIDDRSLEQLRHGTHQRWCTAELCQGWFSSATPDDSLDAHQIVAPIDDEQRAVHRSGTFE